MGKAWATTGDSKREHLRRGQCVCLEVLEVLVTVQWGLKD